MATSPKRDRIAELNALGLTNKEISAAVGSTVECVRSTLKAARRLGYAIKGSNREPSMRRDVLARHLGGEPDLRIAEATGMDIGRVRVELFKAKRNAGLPVGKRGRPKSASEPRP